MVKNISILGSTGSIGTQALDVARNLKINVLGLSAHSNTQLLEAQIREFQPYIAAVADEKQAAELSGRVADTRTKIYWGSDGLEKVASIDEADTVLSSIVGIAGLSPTLAAIRSGKNIALANKETMVTAGELVLSEAKRNNVKILPVDSEHSAIFQCLSGNNRKDVSKIILTASGGPFRCWTREKINSATVEDALKHPNWDMGSKITIDSATLMNKGLEVIEARWLFDIDVDQIQVVVHPQSIIHSMVEYKDGSIIAQMGSPDMRIPIQFALTYPERQDNGFSRLDLLKVRELTFEEPDFERFPSLSLAYKALEMGGTMPAVMNAANEIAVRLYLDKKITFIDIPRSIGKVMELHATVENPGIDDILLSDAWARNEMYKIAAEF